METTKLYSEILNLVEEAEYEEIPNSAIYKMDFEKAALSIEQLIIDKMEGLAGFISREYSTCDFLQFGFEPLPEGILMNWEDQNKYMIKDVVKEYLNK